MASSVKSRRSHHKSRNGCEECKMRRNKCDEQGYPDGPCAACVIRGTSCVYTRPSRRTGVVASLPLTPGNPVEASADSQPVPPEPAPTQDDQIQASTVDLDLTRANSSFSPATRHQELQLMHFWCTRTCNTRVLRDVAYLEQWRVDITHLAFEHQFLLNTILALTSVHMAIEAIDPSLRSTHVNTAIQYQNRALTEFRAALEYLSPENCHAVVACALLNMACSHVSSQLPTANHDQVRTPLGALLELGNASLGVLGIVSQSGPWLRGSIFEHLHLIQENRPPKSDGDPNNRWTPAEIDGIRNAMSRLRLLIGSVSVHEHPVYEDAVDKLERFFLNGSEISSAWLPACSTAFVEAIRQEKTVALMILIHWSRLLRRCPMAWWARFSSSRLLEQLVPMLRAFYADSRWNEALAWCQE